MRSRPASLALLVLFVVLHGGCSGRGHPDGGAPDSTRAARQRLAALEGVRSFGDSTFFLALRHPDPHLRRAAVMGLGRIQDAAALDALLPLLDDPDSTVVEQVAWALRQLQGLEETQRSRLELALDSKIESEPTHKRWMFIEAVRPHASALSFAAVSPWVAAGIYAGMGSEVREPRLEGMAALTLANIDTERARTLLGTLGDLNNRDSEAAWRIAEAIFIQPDSSYLSSVLSLLRHRDAFARAAGARTLSKYPEAGQAAALYPLLADPEWEVRASALRTLGELGDEEARSYCASMTADRHALVREAALVALERLGAGADTHLLRGVRVDPVPAVRLAALRVLAKAEGSKARAVFEAARQDSVDFVGAEALAVAADVLGTEAATELLLRSLAAPSARERAQAAQALGGLGEKLPRRSRTTVRQALEGALEDEDFVVAAQAAAALGALQLGESAAALVAAYQRWQQGHSGIDVRLAVLPALAALPGAGRARATLACLENASAEAEPRLAQAAREALAKARGEKEGPPATAPRARHGAVAAELPAIDLGLVRVRLHTPHGTAVLELDGDDYPRTVGSFLQLVDSGFYANGVFHRVVPAFVVQGGCPRGDGWGDAGTFLPCEIGNLRYDRDGIVGMAHAGKDTGGAQFFITHLPVPRLDGRYTAFGRVVAGMEVVDRIVRGDRFRLERETPAGAVP